jgi:hypothetical protein
MIAAARVESGPSSPAYEYLAQVLRSLLPIVERERLASRDEIGIEMLADRLRQDAVVVDRVIFLPRMVGAWVRLSGQ